jgi:hypothetical protein
MINKDIYKRQKRTYEISNGFEIPNVKQRKLNIQQYEEITTLTKFEEIQKENKMKKNHNRNTIKNFPNPFINNDLNYSSSNNLNFNSNLDRNSLKFSINSNSDNENSQLFSQNSTIDDILEGISLVKINKKDEIINEMTYNNKNNNLNNKEIYKNLDNEKNDNEKRARNCLIKENSDIFNLRKNKHFKLEIKKDVKTIITPNVMSFPSKLFFEKNNKIKTINNNSNKIEKIDSIDIKKNLKIIQEACGKYKNYPMNHTIKFKFPKKELSNNINNNSRNIFSIRNSFNSEITYNSFSNINNIHKNNECSKNFNIQTNINSSRESDKKFSYLNLMTERRLKIKDCFSSVNLPYNIDIKNAFKNLKIPINNNANYNNPEKNIISNNFKFKNINKKNDNNNKINIKTSLQEINEFKELYNKEIKSEKSLDNLYEISISPISTCSKISKDSFKIPIYSNKKSQNIEREKETFKSNLFEKSNIVDFNDFKDLNDFKKNNFNNSNNTLEFKKVKIFNLNLFIYI